MPERAVHYKTRDNRIFSVCGLTGPIIYSTLIAKVTCGSCLKTQTGRLAVNASRNGDEPAGDGWTIEELIATKEAN